MDDVGYTDYEEEDDESDSLRRVYRRVPSGFHDRLRRRNRLLNRNRNKRDADLDFSYDYDPDTDEVQVSPQSEYGVMNIPGNKYGYNRRKYRRYLNRNGYFRSPFFSDPSEKNSIIVDDTRVPSQHDILGLKRYRERNKMKVAQIASGGSKVYRKRSINNLLQTENKDFDLNTAAIPGAQYNPLALQQGGPFLNLSQAGNPYSNVINSAVLGINLRSSDNTTSNITCVQPSAGNCVVKPPITSNFEGLMYPSIQDVLKNMTSKTAKTENEKHLPPSSASNLTLAKNIRDVSEDSTTVHVNSLEDVTHPTSAIEQRILAASDDLFDAERMDQLSTPSVIGIISEDDEREEQYPDFYNPDRKVFQKSPQINKYRAKGSKTGYKFENKNSTPNKVPFPNDQGEADRSDSYEGNIAYEDYSLEDRNKHEESYEVPEERDLVIKTNRKQPIVSQPPPLYYKEKAPFRVRHLLNLHSEGCNDEALCSMKKKRGLPELFGMSNEEDYKDDASYGKQLLKKSNSEGDDDDADGDPYIGKKLKFETKKKENGPSNSKNVHIVGVPESLPTSEPVKMPTKSVQMQSYPTKIRTSRSNDEIIDENNFNLCGTGKNKIYCDMKGETEDNVSSINNLTLKDDFKRKYVEQNSSEPAIEVTPEKEQTNDNFQVFQSNQSPPTGEDLDLNEKPIEKKIKIVQISEIVNKPAEKLGDEVEEKSPVEKPYPDGSRENTERQTAKPQTLHVVPQTPEDENDPVVSRRADEDENPLKIEEESNEDVIEAGFKRKHHVKGVARSKRRNRIHNYLEKLRLGNNKKNNMHHQRHFHTEPKFSPADYAQRMPQPSKHKIGYIEPSEYNDFYVRRARSFQEPHNLQYPIDKQSKRDKPPAAEVPPTTAENKSAPLQLSTELATESYPESSKPPMQYIEYPKQKPVA